MGNDSSRGLTSSTFRRSRRRSKNSGQNYIAEDDMDRNPVESAEAAAAVPKPPTNRMDKLRRSLSFRHKKKSHSKQPSKSTTTADVTQSALEASKTTPATTAAAAATAGSNTPANSSNVDNVTSSSNTTTTAPAAAAAAAASTRPALWLEDEKRVKSGNCSFQVKYLGFEEVTDSRGMHICEAAIEKLLNEKEKKKHIKAILYVSGDSLRVVDQSNKTLLVDQTIEKVSFCAPDRHHENGFAYICRDGTARRWLCHCFMAVKDTLKGTTSGVSSSAGGPFSSSSSGGASGGERLSHAVGCAFSVCLEKKQKRERQNVSVEHGPMHSFARMGSFRQASITERFEDPQMVMPAVEPVPIKQVANPHAIERPKANMDALSRQNPLRASGGALPLPFKRNVPAYSSLKPGELASFKQQQQQQQQQSVDFSPLATQPNQLKSAMLMQNHLNKQQQQASLNTPTTTTTTTNNTNNTSNTVRNDADAKISTISEHPDETVNNPTDASNPNVNELTAAALRLTSQLKAAAAAAAAATAAANNNTNKSPVNFDSSQLRISPSHATTVAAAAAAAASPVSPVSHSHSNLQLRQHTNQQPAYVASPPTPAAQFTPVLTSAAASAFGIQQQQHQQQQQQPPPLPPLPPALANHYASLTPQATPMQPQQQQMTHMNQRSQQLTFNSSMSSHAIASPPFDTLTPLSHASASPLAGGIASMTPSMSLSATTSTNPYLTASASSSGNAAETFEQKWARIQAAKKTNPFAEDIAKKFEIKL